jgi:L-amino acid N-acyltransferase YncA
MKANIRWMESSDWDEVRGIYQEGIDTGNATFEIIIPEWDEWNTSHLKKCRLVALSEKQIVGWAALNPVSNRDVYSGVVEVSIYVKSSEHGLGVGKALLMALIDESESQGIWTLQAGIFPENVASIALHKFCGFRQVGRRHQIGCLHGVWRDVILMERRSNDAGK